MNLKRAIGISIVIYVASMLFGMVACSILGIQPDMTKPIPLEMWVISSVSSVVFAALGAVWYFRGKNLKPSLREGFRFGVSVIVVGFILDFLFFLSLMFENYDPFAAMGMYYQQLPFWITIALVVVVSGLVGMWLEKQKKSS